MNDTLDTQLPVEEKGNLEEAKETITTQENTEGSKLTKESILDKLSDLVEVAAETSRSEVESLKQAYFRIRRTEVEELKEAFIKNGGIEADFSAPVDEGEEKLKELFALYKERRTAALAEEERAKAANYALKLQLIAQLKELSKSQDDFNKLYHEFKNIQTRWKEVKEVPQEHANTLWKEYQKYSEEFYDIIKINNQFRDYDFKKNLEHKTELCELAEALGEEKDVVSAFHQLQKLHEQWREIGPVAKDLREDLWSRFKAASTVINKRHQSHFEMLKKAESKNLEEKTAICEILEQIDFSALKTFKDWDKKNKEVMDLQAKWRTIGFAPKKYNVKIFERYRAACDIYFNKKGEFYKTIKAEMEENLRKKESLCEKAEALKDSTDWSKVTEEMITLQKEWKKVGPVTRKYSDAVWKRFIGACDHFFEERNKNVSSQRSEQHTNLEAKKELIAKINAIDESLSLEEKEVMPVLKELMAKWNEIGHVPFKEKDKIYEAYRAACDKYFDHFKISRTDRQMQNFKSNLKNLSKDENGKRKMLSEREKLIRIYDRMKSELLTYENNIGFFNISSKGGGGLLKEMERKIEKLKSEMDLLEKKIKTIEDNVD